MRFSLSSSSSSESPDINATMNGEKMGEECKSKLFTFFRDIFDKKEFILLN
jgi:hypothetical protein